MQEVSLPQSTAIAVLEHNGLNVSKAIQALYQEKLRNASLYEHMWVEKLEEGGILSKHREKVERMITEGDHKDEVSSHVYLVKH